MAETRTRTNPDGSITWAYEIHGKLDDAIIPAMVPASGHSNSYCEASITLPTVFDVRCDDGRFEHLHEGVWLDVGSCGCSCHYGLQPGDRFV